MKHDMSFNFKIFMDHQTSTYSYGDKPLKKLFTFVRNQEKPTE